MRCVTSFRIISFATLKSRETEYAFSNNWNLKYVTIDEGVYTIGIFVCLFVKRIRDVSLTEWHISAADHNTFLSSTTSDSTEEITMDFSSGQRFLNIEMSGVEENMVNVDTLSFANRKNFISLKSDYVLISLICESAVAVSSNASEMAANDTQTAFIESTKGRKKEQYGSGSRFQKVTD